VWRDAVLVATKDLRVEARSRVATNQVLPFSLLVLVLFAFALEPDRGVLRTAAAGLFWVAVLLATVLAVSRSAALEAGDGGRDALRLSGLDPAGVFLGKAGAVAVQLVALELVLGLGVVVLYDIELTGVGTLAVTAVVATLGLAAAGTLYGAVAAGVRETLLPLLLLPVVAPVLLAATRASEAALGTGVAGIDVGQWLGLLATFAVVYLGVGVVAFGPLLEDS
jgi:heme exporter protein B